MASLAEKRMMTRYQSYGNVAYAPQYAGGTVRVPREEEIYRPRPTVRPRERAIARPQVDVRPAGRVAPFAVLGFLAAAVCAALLVFSYVQLTVLTDQAAAARSELSALETEHSTLAAQYESTFDQASLEAAVGSYMTKPDSSQYIYIDLSEADAVVVYDQEPVWSGAAGLFQGAAEVVGNVVEYFR